ncbi:FAD-dependent oxidoreductase [Verrucomicrobiaceae bacterium 227]
MSRVLVIGGGVAGCAAGIFLAKAGLDVVVVERRKAPPPGNLPKLGESLPPEARTLLEDLGVWPAFLEGGHLPCHSHRSYWGSERATYRDFLNHPLGHGWHLDRWGFDQMLAAHCEARGARILRGFEIARMEKLAQGWFLNGCEHFDFVIDASGRRSKFARSQGVKRLLLDHQLALIAFLESSDGLDDSASLTESTEDGWWYSAAIPGNRVATVFLGRPDEFQRRQWRGTHGWWAHLSGARQTFARFHEDGFQLLSPPRFVSAESSLLESMVGKDWLAVGDAAMSYDPIASHGIMMGMVSARDAALAITSHFSGDRMALAKYHGTLSQAFFQYAHLREALYAQSVQPPSPVIP